MHLGQLMLRGSTKSAAMFSLLRGFKTSSLAATVQVSTAVPGPKSNQVIENMSRLSDIKSYALAVDLQKVDVCPRARCNS